MTKNEFEEILNKCCTQLTDEARTTVFKSSAQFENRVREVLADITEMMRPSKLISIRIHRHSLILQWANMALK